MPKVDVKAAYEKLNTQERMLIASIHILLDNVKDNPERYEDPVQLIEDLEFALQGLWKFPRDASYHTHWLEIKGCRCPKMDNKDPMYYGGGKITVSDCEWHWKGEKV